MHVLAWLQLGRIQTASGTMSIVLLGYLLGGGDLFSLEVILWLLFGFLVHYVGHLDNSVEDYKYDKDDPSKAHFPLVSGVISHSKASLVQTIGLLSLPPIVIVMLYDHFAAQVAVALSYGFGVIYNRLNKISVYKPIPISLTFSLLLLVSYFTKSTLLNPIVLLLFVYIFITMFFEQGFGGELKDIEHDKVSILRKMGAEVKYNLHGDRYFFPTVKVDLFALTIFLAKGTIVFFMMFFTWVRNSVAFYGWEAPYIPLYIQGVPAGNYLYIQVVVFLLLGYAMQQLTRNLVKVRKWDAKERERSIRNLSMLELVSYFFGLNALVPIVGLIQVIVLAAFVPVWFIVMNRVVWKTWLHPRV